MHHFDYSCSLNGAIPDELFELFKLKIDLAAKNFNPQTPSKQGETSGDGHLPFPEPYVLLFYLNIKWTSSEVAVRMHHINLL